MRRGVAGSRTLALAATLLAAAAPIADVVAPRAAVVTVAPVELARWIRAAKPGLDVVDTRAPAEYRAGHIPTARNVPQPARGKVAAEPGSTVVVYGDAGTDEMDLARAVSRGTDVDVRILERGIDGWIDDVLAPRLSADATEAERAAFAEQAELSRWFGGLPRIVPPSQFSEPAGESPASKSRRLLGGC